MPAKIMCVDDSNTIRSLVKKTLVTAGFEFVEAENGQDALDNLSADIELFIVDVNMPVMGGYEFVENLKKQAEYKTKPVVFLTTESSADKKEKGKSLGINGWIVKPFEPASFLKVIDMLVG
ncbi:MAG TPA: two-component system response regulator [Spirochaeta sp.]|nr:two-component system response regulator [Spirochaeta sp.]